MNLILENPSDEALKAFKAMAKALNVSVKEKKSKTKGGALRKALAEVRSGEVVVCKDFEEFKRSIER